MKQLKTKTTTQKFYNKWFYKVSLEMPGSGIFNILALEDILSTYSADNNDLLSFSYTSREVLLNRKNVIAISTFLSKQSCEWAKRIESRQLDIYTNDVEMYNKLSAEFEDIVNFRCEPNPSTLDLYTNDQTVVVKKYPHNRYLYKVYLWPHKMPSDIEIRQKFLNWADKQQDKIRISEAVKNWFLKTRYNWDRRYILVEDEKTLLMLKLINSEIVGRIYKYVVHDK
jgi:hypothetical protein